MTQLDKIETTLDTFLRKKAPVQVPPEGRSWIARNAWWLALISGLCLLWSSLVLWQAGHTVDRFAEVYQSWTGQPYVHRLGISYYLSLLATAGTGVLMLLATANLKDMRRSGWRYLLYASLLQALASVFLLFSDFGGFARFVGSLISAGVGAYFLFQIRDFFTEKGAAHSAALHEAKKPAKKTDTDESEK
jgi:ABC-type glycerol-3-phosphate transport system permease component